MGSRYFDNVDTDMKIASWDGEIEERVEREQEKRGERYFEKRKRKVRSDAKKRVKIPLSYEQKEKLKFNGKFNSPGVEMPYTNFSTKLVAEGIGEPFIQNAKREHGYPEEYESTELYVSIKLDKEEHDKLWELSVKWDCSIRQVGYTILVYMLNRYPEPQKELPQEKKVEVPVRTSRFGFGG
ncbi:hypothetical protein [Metabacillus fastidiosus]|uniref:hypothetical protein n=1 Tax=Metabacillus fastidiosus TaxID=1458 RepID=UPI002E1B94DA|nr:hypothetical protein [Metabacillus fastidiosus]